MIRAGHTMLRTEPVVILKDFSLILLQELDADCPLPGDAARQVRGLAVDEPVKGWISSDEVAVTAREWLDEEFLRALSSAGSHVVVWRTEGEVTPQTLELAANLGLGLFVLPPAVPLRRLLSYFSGD